jgi:hypothetical protein
VPFHDKNWKEKTCVSSDLSFPQQKDHQEIDHQQESIPCSVIWNSIKKNAYLWQKNSNLDSNSNQECISWPELLELVITTKLQNFTWNLFKVIIKYHASFRTFLTIISVYFYQLLQGRLSNRYLEKYLIIRNYIFCPWSGKKKLISTNRVILKCLDSFSH